MYKVLYLKLIKNQLKITLFFLKKINLIIFVLLRKKHFEKLRIEELLDDWKTMGPGDRKGKLGKSVLAELDGLDSELVVKLKFEHLGIEPENE